MAGTGHREVARVRRGRPVISITLDVGDTALELTRPLAGVARLRVPGDLDRGFSYALGRRPGRLPLGSDGLSIAAARGAVSVSLHGHELGSLSVERRRRGVLAARCDVPGCRAVLGLGEKSGGLDKRGRRWRFWNQDVLLVAGDNVPADIDPLYVAVPFALVLAPAGAFGLLLDQPGACAFDLRRRETLRLESAAGLDLYVLAGPTPRDVVQRLARLTGHMPLPPLWALGYHQCRYSYHSEREVRRVVDGLRRHALPCDALWLDIHYMDRFRDFTWSPRGFRDPPALTAALARAGLRTVVIVDPGLPPLSGYPPHEAMRAIGGFCTGADGRPFAGRAWPGEVVFPDFTRPDVRRLWGELQGGLLDAGVDGLWVDMNEPSLGRDDDGELVDDGAVRYHDRGHHSPAAVVRNVYGSCMAEATRAGLMRRRPDTRPFVLTRAGYTGVQRFATVWTGDVPSTWEALRQSLPTLLGLGLSGVPFVGADVGGFLGDCEPELFARWVEAACLTPFFRNHTALGSRRQEPWTFGREVLAATRRQLELRYALLPYLYGCFAEAARTGEPIMKALAYVFPDDDAMLGVEDAFLIGTHLLVAPVLERGARRRTLRLPAGAWLDFYTGETYRGRADLDAPLGRLPLLVRAGAVIPTVAPAPHVGAIDPDTLALRVYAAAVTPLAGELYEDDGTSLAYRRGVRSRRPLRGRVSGAGGVLRVGPSRGSFEPGRRRARVLVFGAGEPLALDLRWRSAPIEVRWRW